MRRHVLFTIITLASLTLASAAEIDSGRAATLPWSGYWWPHSQGLLHATNGPLDKYDRITGHTAAKWERERYPTGEDVPRWHGYCHAWCAGSILEAEPTATRRHSGESSEPVTLGVGDQKGLLTVSHTRDTANVYGTRFNPGDSDEARSDLAPDALWRLLKLYVQKQKLPLVLDMDAGEQVWNYPVYAYKVESSAQGEGGKYSAKLTLWMADDAVRPDFRGVKARRHTYQFTYEKRGTSVVMGSAKWTGPSVTDHPDFAWYPLTAVAENPEVDVPVVQRIVHDGQAAVPTPAPRPDPEPTPEPEPEYDPDHPSEVVNSADQPRRRLPSVLSPQEVVQLIANRTSDFDFDATVDRFDGGMYRIGESLTVSGSSERAGYLTLLHITPTGDLHLLAPRAGKPLRVPAGKRFRIKTKFTVIGPPGPHRIKAVITTRPLAISGTLPNQQFRWTPTQQQAVRQMLVQHTKGESGAQLQAGEEIRRVLGTFAQDEILFGVQPAPKEKPQPKLKPRPDTKPEPTPNQNTTQNSPTQD